MQRGLEHVPVMVPTMHLLSATRTLRALRVQLSLPPGCLTPLSSSLMTGFGPNSAVVFFHCALRMGLYPSMAPWADCDRGVSLHTASVGATSTHLILGGRSSGLDPGNFEYGTFIILGIMPAANKLMVILRSEDTLPLVCLQKLLLSK